jgi:dTDP-4-amino-4,6-dideoxygalactose transaminase
LPHLDSWTSARRKVAGGYTAAGLGDAVRLPQPTAGAEHAFHLYVIRTPRRNDVAARLSEHGVEARAYYTTPLHRQPSMSRWASASALPNAERLATEGLALPMGPSLGPDDVERVVEAVGAASRRGSGQG